MAKATKTAKKGASKASPVTTSSTVKATAVKTQVAKGLPGWPKAYLELIEKDMKVSEIAKLTGKKEPAVYAKMKYIEDKKKQAKAKQTTLPVAKVQRVAEPVTKSPIMLKHVEKVLDDIEADEEEYDRSFKLVNKYGTIMVDPTKVKHFETDGFVFKTGVPKSFAD